MAADGFVRGPTAESSHELDWHADLQQMRRSRGTKCMRRGCNASEPTRNATEDEGRTREGVADAIGRKEGVKTGKRGASASGVLAAEAAARVREERRRRATAGDHDSPTAWKSFLMNPFLSI